MCCCVCGSGGIFLAGPTRKMSEFLPDLCEGQDAPDGGPRRVWVALALPPLGVLGGRCRIGMVTVTTMTFRPRFHAVGVGSRRDDPAAFGTHVATIADPPRGVSTSRQAFTDLRLPATLRLSPLARLTVPSGLMSARGPKCPNCLPLAGHLAHTAGPHWAHDPEASEGLTAAQRHDGWSGSLCVALVGPVSPRVEAVPVVPGFAVSVAGPDDAPSQFQPLVGRLRCSERPGGERHRQRITSRR
jgi:hypothetical protein